MMKYAVIATQFDGSTTGVTVRTKGGAAAVWAKLPEVVDMSYIRKVEITQIVLPEREVRA